MKMKQEHREEIRTAVALAVDDASAFFEKGSLIRNAIRSRAIRWDLCSTSVLRPVIYRLLGYLEHKHIDTMMIKALKELEY